MYQTETSTDRSQTTIKALNKQKCSTHIDVKRLSTIMNDLGHSHIDLLKMDIEGAEYDVIDDFLDHEIHVSQLLVEFHHFFSDISIRQTRRSIQRLMNEYKLFYIDPRKVEFSFIRNE
jgi:hypothetical protein